MLGELLSLGCALAWGVSVILFKRSEEASPQAINLYKNTVGTLLLGLTLAFCGGLPAHRSPEDWARLVVSGVLGLAVADTLFLEALRRLGAGLMAVLDCIYAPLVSLFSVLMLDETLGLSFAAGATLVVVGLLAATVSPDVLRAAAGTTRAKAGGIALGLASIAVMAFALVLVKPVLDRGNLVEVTFFRLLAGTVSLAGWMAIRPGAGAAFGVLRPQRVWRPLFPAAVLGTYVSMLLWLGGMKYTSVSTASVLNQLSVLFTLVLARLVLKEPLTARRLWGGGASLAGAIVILLGAAS